jgi:hypothetical protein
MLSLTGRMEKRGCLLTGGMDDEVGGVGCGQGLPCLPPGGTEWTQR